MEGGLNRLTIEEKDAFTYYESSRQPSLYWDIPAYQTCTSDTELLPSYFRLYREEGDRTFILNDGDSKTTRRQNPEDKYLNINSREKSSPINMMKFKKPITCL